MANKPLESTKVVDNNTIKNQTLKPKYIGSKKSNFSNFSKVFKKYQTAIISFALVLVLLVGGSLAYFKINNDLNDNDKASASNTDLSLYISTTGDDNNPGTLAQPFKTIYKARDYIRANKTTTASGNVTVNLRGGEYFLTETFKLEAQDSATDGHTITYQSYAGENATLSGGRKLTGWTLHDSTKNIYKSFVGTSGVKDVLSVYPRQMFVNGDRAVRARSEENPAWLKRDFAKDGNNVILSDDLKITDSNYFGINSWQNKEDIETINIWNWRASRCLVDTIVNSIIVEDDLCNRQIIDEFNGGKFIVDTPRLIENAYELLGSENEWYYNKTDGYFYYKPVSGFDFNTANIVTPQTEYLLNIKGDVQNKASNIKFQNLDFQYGAWSDVNRGNVRNDGRNYIVTQAGVDPTGNNMQSSQITSQYSQNILFNNIKVLNMGSGGVEFGVGAENNRLINSEVRDISGIGVTIGSLPHYTAVGEPSTKNVVYNNLIEKIGVEYQDGIGVFNYYANNTLIKHNEITNVAYSGISSCLGWRDMTNSKCFGNTIEANKIHKTMQVLRDGGGIYLNSVQPNGLVKNNYLYDNPNDFGGLYPDDGTTFTSWIGNVEKSSPIANSTDTQPWLFMWNSSVNYNNVLDNYYQSTKINNSGSNNNFGDCRTNIATSLCASQCSTPIPVGFVGVGSCFGSNLQFTNDTDYPEINQIISRAGLCAVKNENYSECDVVPPCTNGAINPGTCDNFSPEGGVDKIENGKVYAWAKDGASTTKVKVYFGNDAQGVMNYVGEFDCNNARADVNNGFGCEVDLLSVLGATTGKYTAFVFAKDATPASDFTKYLGSIDFSRGGPLTEIDTVTCTPTPAISGSTVNCTSNLTLPVDKIDNTHYSIPSGGLYLGFRQTWGVDSSYSGNSDLCTISLNILTCNNIPVPNVGPGKYQIVGHRPGVTWVIPTNDIGIDISPYIVNDSSVGTASCTPSTINKSPTDTAYTNCTFPLTGSPNGVYALPAVNTADGNTVSLAAAILNVNGDAYANRSFLGNSDSCTVSGQSLVCNNVPIPSSTNIGSREIIIHQPNINFFYGKGFLSVEPPLVVSDVNVGTASCTPSTINKSPTDTAYTNCTFPLTGSPNGVYALPAVNTANGNTISLAAAILNVNGDADGNGSFLGNSNPCTISGATLVCNNVRIPSNTNIGNREIIIHQPNVNYFWNKGFLTVNASLLTDPVLIPKTATTITESPNPEATGLSIYGKSDYSLTVKDARLNKVGTVDTFCYFKIKEATAIDGNSDKGYEKLTSTVNGGLGVLTSTTSGAAYDTTTKSYKVTYDNTNGANIKLASGKQLYTDYNLQIRCTRSDSQAFARDQKINFLFGAYSVVDISGQVG